jgi:AcrR family transcriptional regulator
MSKMNRKKDPRIIRTLQLLRAALVEAMNEKNYSAITIQDITDHATLNRATFYLHYKDKNELLKDTLDEMITSTRLLPAQDDQPVTQYALNALTNLFNQFAEKSGFYRTIFSGENIPTFNALVNRYIQDIGLKWLTALQPDDEMFSIHPEFIIHYLGSAFLGVVNWWLEKDMPYSAEEMAFQLLRLTTLGLHQTLGLDIPKELLPDIQARSM